MSDNNACWWPLINPAGASSSEHPAAREVNGGKERIRVRL